MIFVIRRKSIIIVAVILIIALGALTFADYKMQSREVFAIPLTNKVIIIDAGHGGIDAGASANGATEKEINLKIALKLQKYIEQSGGVAILTRSEDGNIADPERDKKISQKKSDMSERKKSVEKYNGDMFISIHMNKFSQEKYSGAQVFYSKSDESKRFGEKMQESLRDNLDKNNNRKAKPKNDAFVLKDNKVPSVIIECGFLSNKPEAEKLMTEEYQQKVAWSIYAGINKYFFDK